MRHHLNIDFRANTTVSQHSSTCRFFFAKTPSRRSLNEENEPSRRLVRLRHRRVLRSQSTSPRACCTIRLYSSSPSRIRCARPCSRNSGGVGVAQAEVQRERRTKAAAQKRKATGVLLRRRSRSAEAESQRGLCGGAVLPSALILAECAATPCFLRR